MSDVTLDIIKQWLTNSVSTSTGSGPPGEVFSAYESLVNERNAAKTRAAKLEADRAVLVKGVLAAKKPVFAAYAGVCKEFQDDYDAAFDLAKEKL